MFKLYSAEGATFSQDVAIYNEGWGLIVLVHRDDTHICVLCLTVRSLLLLIDKIQSLCHNIQHFFGK